MQNGRLQRTCFKTLIEHENLNDDLRRHFWREMNENDNEREEDGEIN